MTKYYLHGGRVGIISVENERFFRELLGETPLHVNILIVLFAREKSLWEDKYRETQSRFQSTPGEKILHFELAQDDIEVFRRQIRASDIIFIHGGSTERLRKKLEKIEDLEILFEDKVVAGSSAGALVFAKYYYENDTDSCHKGLGFFDIGMICHWNDQKKELAYIQEYGGVDEVLCIPEGSYEIREK